MGSVKYIAMDVHKESTSIAVSNDEGKTVMEFLIETKASMILQVIDGLRGALQVTLREGTSAAWLYDLPKSYVTKLVVFDPLRIPMIREAGGKLARNPSPFLDLLQEQTTAVTGDRPAVELRAGLASFWGMKSEDNLVTLCAHKAGAPFGIFFLDKRVMPRSNSLFLFTMRNSG